MIGVFKSDLEYRKLGWVSGYMASKYFLDEASAHLWDLFPESPTQITADEISVYERNILRVLDFKIYEHTIFTFLKERAFYAVLFLLMLKPDFVYDKPVIEIMKIFNRGVDQIKITNPHMMLPTD